MREKAFKNLLYSAIFIMAIATIAGCDKDNSETGDGEKTSTDYVDLGLPSGTKWKTVNETNPNDTNNFYTYDEAMAAFGDKLPTKEQFEELMDSCQWTWTNNGYTIVGSNGKSIFLPAFGARTCDGIALTGSSGLYWSSTPGDSKCALYLYFYSGRVLGMYNDYRCWGRSVRLVK
jgi:hypothetical protein